MPSSGRTTTANQTPRLATRWSASHRLGQGGIDLGAEVPALLGDGHGRHGREPAHRDRREGGLVRQVGALRLEHLDLAAHVLEPHLHGEDVLDAPGAVHDLDEGRLRGAQVGDAGIEVDDGRRDLGRLGRLADDADGQAAQRIDGLAEARPPARDR